jgi:hypothetical protein
MISISILDTLFYFSHYTKDPEKYVTCEQHLQLNVYKIWKLCIKLLYEIFDFKSMTFLVHPIHVSAVSIRGWHGSIEYRDK